MARTMLAHKNFSHSLWANAMSIAVHILNHAPTSFVVAGMTPFEAYFESNPDVSCFCVFGCDAYAHIPKLKGGSLIQRS